LSPISCVVIDLTLTTLLAFCAFTRPVTIWFASCASRAQWTWPPALVTFVLKLDQVRVEVGEGMVLDRLGGLAELLPVRKLGHRPGTLGADGVRGVGEVRAELGVGDGPLRGVRDAGIPR